MLKKLLLALASWTLALGVQAGVIVDVVTQTELLDAGNWSHSYVHDLNDNGFVLGSALSGTLSIDLYDDGDRWFETAVIVVEDFDFDTGSWTWVGSWDNSLGINALAAINSNGLLNVEIWKGLLSSDFYVGDSTLTVMTPDITPHVAPAPTPVALLGLAIAALAMARKRRV